MCIFPEFKFTNKPLCKPIQQLIVQIQVQSQFKSLPNQILIRG